MRDMEMIVKTFKGFCDENRLQILELLRHGEKCACVILEDLKISQPTLSHHMKVLCDSGMIESQKRGKWTHYTISQTGVRHAVELLMYLTEPAQADKKAACCEQD